VGHVKKFPLAPLVKLRAHAVEDCRDTLLERNLHLQQARRAQVQAEQSERVHDAHRYAIEQEEAERMASGQVTASDLHQLAEYQRMAAAQALCLRQENQSQLQKVRRAEQEVSAAEQRLAEVKAEQRVLERQQARFTQQENAKLELGHEEEGLEVWNGREGSC
jgi:hypothetical protein